MVFGFFVGFCGWFFVFVLGGLRRAYGFGCVCGFVRVCNRLAFCAFKGLCALFVILVCAIFGLTCVKNNFCHT